MDQVNNYLFRAKEPMFKAIWCVDSETGEECLIDLASSTIIAKRVNGKITDPGVKPC